MTRRPQIAVVAAAGILLPAICYARPDPLILTDPPNDAVTRRTDPVVPGGIIDARTGRPDLIQLAIGGWRPSTVNPATDPYTGAYVHSDSAEIFRLDVTFKGLLNPPGRLFNGPFNPFQFGYTPLLGFIEFDIDNDKDTGGELDGTATNRLLANVARFGARPQDSIGQRIATSAADYDFDFYSDPQFERSGEDFALVFCGCSNVTIVSQDGNNDGIFDPGETWVVRGRFFQRAAGYSDASSVFGGSAERLYDPLVNVRFQHSLSTGNTTVTLVFPLTMHGAALLTGQPEQAIDFDVSNHVSVVEAIHDLVVGASGPLFGPVWDLTNRWNGRNPNDFLDPSRWDVTALVGTSYAQPVPGAYFIWTDVGFGLPTGDVNGDGLVNGTDRAIVQSVIDSNHGPVQIDGFSQNFSLYDVTYDGFINSADVDFYGGTPCPADWDGVNGVTSSDFFAFIADFFAGNADFNRTGTTDSLDFFDFLMAFFAGC
jgi:hypothetical protein